MAQQINQSDIEVLISCIKNSSIKLTPNFEKVAAECGLKDSKVAYMRHWRMMMKKLGLASDKTQAQKPKQNMDAATKKKRSAAAIENDEDDSGDGEDLGEQAVPKASIKKHKKY